MIKNWKQYEGTFTAEERQVIIESIFNMVAVDEKYHEEFTNHFMSRENAQKLSDKKLDDLSNETYFWKEQKIRDDVKKWESLLSECIILNVKNGYRVKALTEIFYFSNRYNVRSVKESNVVINDALIGILENVLEDENENYVIAIYNSLFFLCKELTEINKNDQDYKERWERLALYYINKLGDPLRMYSEGGYDPDYESDYDDV